MEQATVRLSKVLKELNISSDRALDFLKTHGYDIDANPNTKITDEMHRKLLEEFQSDKSTRIQSEKISAQKEKEKAEVIKEVEEREEIIKARKQVLAGPVVIGTVNLDKPKKAPETAPLEATPPAAQEEAAPEQKRKTTASEASLSPGEPADKDAPKLESTPNENAVLAKEKEAPAPPDIIRAVSKRLTGPVLTGEKIDLKQFEKKPPKPVEPAVSQPQSSKPDAPKRKRVRITKEGAASDPKKQHSQKSKFIPKVALTDEEIQKQVRETLEKLQGKSSKSKGSKYRKEKRDSHRQKSQEELELQDKESKILQITEFVTASEIASFMDVPVNEVISACMSLGIMVAMNQRLNAETLSIVAEEFGYEIQFTTDDIEEAIPSSVEENPEDMAPRAPIITVMGHVDHGKTSLLDYIREENVIAGESGGITQHIGAYAVTLENGQKITFLDTPGHEAFTAMRARGTQLTDIAVIVIAADDDIMPQTREAISHAQAASVPIIFAINKIDKPSANPEKIKESLSKMNLLVEDWGGKIQSQEISAKTGKGIPELLEKVLLEAELLDLKANPKTNASGSVIEAFLDKGRGYISTVLVQSGTLRVGDYVLAGKNSGKVRAIFDERANALKQAPPSTPVSILGLDGAPQAGDKFYVFKDEKEAKQIAGKRSQLYREQTIRTQRHITLDEIGRRIALGDFKELNIILKADVDGSVEALTDSIQKLSTEEIQIKIIHKGLGAITESDVLLASASDAIIIGFNVRASASAKTLADKEQIDIRTYSIIYDIIENLKDAIEGMLSPEIKEEITGAAEVRQLFKVSKVGTIAGCMVTSGKIFNSSMVRVVRDGVVVHDGKLASLKRIKDDVKEVSKGFECGMQVRNFNDLLEGDIIEAYKEVEIRKKLK